MFIKKVSSISNEKIFQSNWSEIPTQSMGLQLYYISQYTTTGGYSTAPYPFIYHSSQKGAPFVYRLLLTNGTPFTYLVQNFASLLTVVNALLFKQESITKIECFLDFIKPQNLSVSPLGPFTDPNDRYFNKYNPYPFIYLKPEKGSPFQGSKFKFDFGSTWATRCKFLGAQLKIILGAQLIMLGATISKEKVKSLRVPRLFVIFSLLLLLQSCD